MAEKQDDNLLKIEKDKDKSNLVTDENMQGFVYDIHDVIETSQERPAIKARNLIQAGVSMELFVAAYTNMTPNVTNIDEALTAIDETFKHLAQIISNYPNGIVIDMETGKIDEKSSDKQARKVGIHDDGMKKTREEVFNERFQEALNSDKKIARLNKVIKAKSLETELDKMMSKFKGGINANFDIYDFLNNNNETNIDNMSKEFQKYFYNRKFVLVQYSNEEMEYMRIEHELEHSKSGPRFMELLRQRTKFLEENPQLLDFKTRDEDGNIDPKIESFMEAERDAVLGGILAKFSDVEFDAIESNKIKKFMAITALAASGIDAYKNDAFKTLGLENSTLKEKLDFLNKVLGTRMKTQEDLNQKRDLFLKALEHAMDISKMFENIEIDKISDHEIDNLIERMGESLTIKDITKNVNLSIYQKHFENSKLEFTDTDEAALKKGFRDATNDSWVNSEKEAKELLLAERVFKIEELEKINTKTMTGQAKLKAQREKLAGVLEKYPELKDCLDENGNLKKDIRNKAMDFEYSKRKSVILSKYMKDLSFKKEFSREDFDQYTNVEKRDYYRMALIGLEYAEENNDPVLKKLALRRFENLNTDELTCVTINEDGSYELNEQVVVDEFNKINNSIKYDNLHDLKRKLVAQYNETNVSHRLEEILEHGVEPIEGIEDLSADEKYKKIMEMRERANAKNAVKKQKIKLEKHETMLKYTEKTKAALAALKRARHENNDQVMNGDTRDEVETKTSQEQEMSTNLENQSQSWWSKIKDFVKQKILKNDLLRLTDGTEKFEEKKEGFFAKLFGIKNDDVAKNSNKENVAKLESKMDAYKLDNSDGRIEQGATDLSNSTRDGTTLNNGDRAQMQMDDKEV